MRFKTFMARIWAFFTRKRIIWTIVIVLVLLLGWFIFGRSGANSTIQTGIAKVADVQKTVLTTGQVVSSTDLDLSFQASGVVRRINVKEGDKVYAGQIIATLDQGSAEASLESAQGSLAQAQANYDKLSTGGSDADIAVSQAAVDSAQTTLDNAKQNLHDALSTAYNNSNTVVLSDTNILFSNPLSQFPQFGVSGTVQTNSQLVTNVNNERVAVNTALSKWQTEIANLSESNTDQTVTDSQAYLSTISNYLTDVINLLTTYTQITSGGSQSTLSTYQTSVGGGKTTVDAQATSITTYVQAVRSAGSALVSAKASLTLKKSPARQEDLDFAKAQVLSAQGQVHSAEALLNNTMVVAPVDGTITQVDIKLGEQAVGSKEVIKLQNVGELHAEADVSEADIASVVVGQSIDNTFDALGPDKHFTSKVLTVNPASTVVSGVVDYKVTSSLENIPEVKPGMTVNMTILVAEKKDVLVIPSSAIINQNGKKLVKVIDDSKKKTYHEVEVTTGLEADGGLTEITSGITSGQEIVTYIK